MNKQPMDSRQFREWNEAMAGKYDSESYHLRSSLIIRWIERRRVRAVLDFLDARPEDTVLEVGCGAGVVLEQVPAGFLIGADLAATMLPRAKRRLSHRPAGVLQAAAEQLPFASRSQHKLYCTEVIEHVLEPQALVRELARVATREAIVIITIPNEKLIEQAKSRIIRLGLARWFLQGSHDSAPGYDSPGDANEWHLHQFDLALLQEIIAGSLDIVALRAVPFRWLPLRYVVCCRPKE